MTDLEGHRLRDIEVPDISIAIHSHGPNHNFVDEFIKTVARRFWELECRVGISRLLVLQHAQVIRGTL